MAFSVMPTARRSRMSSSRGSASPPMRDATVLAESSLASSTVTLAPWPAAPFAIASPIPEAPPMTAATLPTRLKSPGCAIKGDPREIDDGEGDERHCHADDIWRETPETAPASGELCRDCGGDAATN